MSIPTAVHQHHHQTQGTRRTQRGLVAAAFPDAAEAGTNALRAGGNAVDAACAAAWTLCVCEPGESGLGGQTTILIRLSDGTLAAVDGHSHAPKTLTRLLVKRRDQEKGVRAATIPSTVATLAEAQRRFGRLSLSQVLQPAISLAREGYAITALQRRLLRWMAPHFLPGTPEATTFLRRGREPYEPGDIFRQPLLAATLERLAAHGSHDFYEGHIARDIALHMQNAGGLITESDLRSLGLPVIREPLSIPYAGHTVVGLPPPGGGVQTLLALRLLTCMGTDVRDDAGWTLALATATHLAFCERERWPDHPSTIDASLRKWLVSEERARTVVARAHTHPTPPADSFGERGNTTHLCAVDDEGNAVSLTQSVQSVFGAKVVHPTLGFVYNNYLSTCPRTRHPYRLKGQCLPQSNASPTIVLDASGRPVLVIGSAGSRRITSSVVQVISAVLDRGTALADAVAAPRVHALLNGTLWVERGVPAAVRQSLETRFRVARELSERSYKLGAVQACLRSESDWTGAADPRRDGAVAMCDA